jgi:flagellar basal body rod protein FlgC
MVQEKEPTNNLLYNKEFLNVLKEYEDETTLPHTAIVITKIQIKQVPPSNKYDPHNEYAKRNDLITKQNYN